MTNAPTATASDAASDNAIAAATTAPSPPARVQLGCLLPTRGLLLADRKPTDAESVLRLAAWAEAAGMDSVWVGDSLTAKPRLEAMTTLAAIAARTTRVRLGTAVMLMALRHPTLLAQMAGTVDLISGGRLQLGVGVGGAFNAMQQAEWRNAGVNRRTRARRLEEMLQVVKGLNSGQPFTFHGTHFQLDEVVMEPAPAQPGGVPVYLGVHWHGRGDGQGARREQQARRAARLADGVISISATPPEFTELMDTVRGYCPEYDRNPDHMAAVMYPYRQPGQRCGARRSGGQRLAAGLLRRQHLGRPLGPLRRPRAGAGTHPRLRRRRRRTDCGALRILPPGGTDANLPGAGSPRLPRLKTDPKGSPVYPEVARVPH